MIVSSARTPEEFQAEIVKAFDTLIRQLGREKDTAKPRRREELLCAIDELQGLLAFVKSVKFSPPTPPENPSFSIPPPSSRHR